MLAMSESSMIADDDPASRVASPPPPGKPVRQASAFLALCPSGALLGLDPGSRTMGVAASDATRRIATPLETIRRRGLRGNLDRLAELATERSARGIVLGYPLNMDGSEGPRAQSARQTAVNLISGLALPVLLWDERLSTFEAHEILREQGVPKAGRDARIDAVAASVILRDALEALARERRRPAPNAT